MTIGLSVLVERYLSERRRLGFQLRSHAYSLRSLAEHVRRTRHRGPLTIEVMAEWARQDSHGSTDPRTWARRLKNLRSFTRWLQQFEPATEVPDDTIFGRLPERLAPHIYNDDEVNQLLAAARQLGPSPGLRGLVYETLFGLIASTGLRLSEALSLNVGDVDLRRGLFLLLTLLYNTGARVSEIVSVRVADVVLDGAACVHLHGKGRKERSVPLWKSTVAAIRAWLRANPELRAQGVIAAQSFRPRHDTVQRGATTGACSGQGRDGSAEPEAQARIASHAAALDGHAFAAERRSLQRHRTVAWPREHEHDAPVR